MSVAPGPSEIDNVFGLIGAAALACELEEDSVVDPEAEELDLGDFEEDNVAGDGGGVAVPVEPALGACDIEAGFGAIGGAAAPPPAFPGELRRSRTKALYMVRLGVN